jgi:hypothetical protein
MALGKAKKPKGKIAKFFMIFGGVTAVALGAIGIFVPVLPTTPFLLLAAYLFLGSSQNLYRWLLTHRILGIYIKNYIQHKAIAPRVKVFTLTLLWISITYSIYITKGTLWLQILLGVIALGVTIHILQLKNTSPLEE